MGVDGSGCQSLLSLWITMSLYECNFLYPYTSIHTCPVTSYVENGQVFFKKNLKHKIRTACMKS